MTMLKLTNVSKSFGVSVALKEVTLTARKGVILAVLGPSGSGKTTLLRLIAGFERPHKGEIEINGVIVAAAGIFVPPSARQVGMVFQDLALWPHMNIARHLDFVLSPLVKNNHKKRELIDRALRLVRLDKSPRALPSELSGGEKQRLALARAIAPEPAILLLDEPFGNLDPPLKKALISDVRIFVEQTQTTVIYVTHDLWEAQTLAEELAVLVDGEIEQRGRATKLLNKGRIGFLKEASDAV